MARCIDNIDFDFCIRSLRLVKNRRVFCEDRNAALALKLVRIHDTRFHNLVVAEGAGLAKHVIDKRGLAMIDVCNNGDIA